MLLRQSTGGPEGQEHLLERAAELDRVQDLLEHAVAGQGRCLALTGPPGIGKTTIASTALEAGGTLGMAVGRAVGGALERDHPFAATRDLLVPLVAAAPLRSRPVLLAGAAGRAAPVLGMTGVGLERSGDEDPGSVLHGLYWLVANLAERAPLLLAVDDAQWLDAPSLRLLAYLARRLDGLPVALLVACRPPEAGPEGALLAALLADPAVELLQPEPLSTPAVTRLVRARLSEQADEEFCQACADAGGGNPFLTIELLRALHDAQVEPVAAAASEVAGIGARRAGRAILRRLHGLSEAATELSYAVAVLGADANLGLAAQLAMISLDEAADAADLLRRSDLMVSEGPLRFSHPLVAAAVYDSLAASARARAHGQAAHLLDVAGAVPAHIGAHLLAAEPSGDHWAVRVLLDAGRSALAQGAPDTAARFLDRALREPPPPEQRVEVLVALGRAERALNRPSVADHFMEALALTADPGTRLEIALALHRPLVALRRARDAVLVMQGLRCTIDDEGGRLRLDAAIVATATAASDAASSAAADVEALCRRIERGDDLPPYAAVVGSLVSAMKNRPREPLGRLTAEAVAKHRIAPGAELPMWCVSAQWTLVMCEHDEEDATSSWLIEQAQRQGESCPLGMMMSNRAFARLRRGDLNAAEADARTAVEIDVLCDAPDALGEAVAAIVEILLLRDDVDGATALLARHGLDGPIDPLPMGQELLVRARGLLRLAEGRTEDAIAEFRAAGRGFASRGGISPAYLPWRSDLAGALAMAGPLDEAVSLAEEEVALARSFGAPRTLGHALRCLGAITGDEAILDEAVRVLENSRGDLGLGAAFVDLGALQRRRNSRAEARESLARGLDLVTRCGATALATKARLEIGRAGGRPRRAALTGPESLTAAEGRVAALAVEGRTNKEIAQAMFVSQKTVESQLAAAFRKLHVANRRELVAAFAARG